MARTRMALRRSGYSVGTKWVAADLITPDVSNGNFADNDGATYLLLVNGATPRTCTVTTPGTFYGYTIGDQVYSMAANESGLFGPFPVAAFSPLLLLDFSATDLKALLISGLPELRA